MNSVNKNQDNVHLQKKFGEWNYGVNGLEKRLPYLYKQRLTTSNNPEKNYYGSITGK